jgi:hypothetical protein
MMTLLRLIGFEFMLIRMLFFRLIFERLANTFIAALSGSAAVYFYAFASRGVFEVEPKPENYTHVHGMILFAFLYAETIMANWQYTTNKGGRMELIFNSTQPPLKIILAKNFASACITLASMIVIAIGPAAWFGLLGALNLTFWVLALPTLLVCCSIMTFNAFFEFKFKQVKAITAVLNLMLPYMAMQYAVGFPKVADVIPYFNTARFLSKTDGFTLADVGLLYGTSAFTAACFLFMGWLLVRRIRRTASVYLE